MIVSPATIRSPAEYIETFFHINGKPFRFKGREYLIPIYNSKKRTMVLKCSRQTEKSSTLACKGILLQTSLNGNLMAVLPTQEQARNFSNARYKRVLIDSPMLKEGWFSDSDAVLDQVFNKRLSSGSETYFRYAFRDAERCRGYSCDFLFLDEKQDLLRDHIPIIEETLSHSPYKIRMFSGTPKTFDNPLEQDWRRSTQTEWCIQCEGCKRWQYITIKNIDRKGLICHKCGQRIYASNGRWVAQNPAASWDGYRICHPMVPWVKWDEIIEKLETYSPGTFSNEVLGISYDTSDRVITITELKACCDENRGIVNFIPEQYIGQPMFAGIDWGKGEGGGSYTTLLIGSPARHSQDKFMVWYLKRYIGAESDPEFQVKDIAKTCAKWGCMLVGADHGFGFLQNKMLKKYLTSPGGGHRVLEFQAAQVSTGPILRWTGNTERFTMHRTKCLSDTILNLKQAKVRFPMWKAFEPFSGDFLSVYQDYSEKARTTYYDHSPGDPDDMMFSLTYALQCRNVYFGMNE